MNTARRGFRAPCPPRPPGALTPASCFSPTTPRGASLLLSRAVSGPGSSFAAPTPAPTCAPPPAIPPHAAPTANPPILQSFGINVPRMVTLTYGFGVGLAALAGVMAAPIYQVSPQMGSDLIIVVFAVVVIGGMGSILGSIITGFGLGLIEALT